MILAENEGFLTEFQLCVLPPRALRLSGFRDCSESLRKWPQSDRRLYKPHLLTASDGHRKPLSRRTRGGNGES
jgi:hypothetical protein